MKPKKTRRRRHRTKSNREEERREHREYHAYVVCNDEEDLDYRVRKTPGLVRLFRQISQLKGFKILLVVVVR